MPLPTERHAGATLLPTARRRVSHYAVREDEEVPPLECDAVCRLEGRRAALADAFGVADPAHRLSYWDSHRCGEEGGVGWAG